MNDLSLVIQIGLGILALIAIVFYWFNGKQKEIKNVLYLLVSKAEQTYLKGENANKLKLVLSNYEKYVPFYLRFFINKDVIVDKWLPELILVVEKELGYQPTIDSKIKEVVNSARTEALNAIVSEIDLFANTAKAADFFGDKNIISNEQIDKIKNDTFKKYEDAFNVKINAKTDFKGNNEASAQAEFKF